MRGLGGFIKGTVARAGSVRSELRNDQWCGQSDVARGFCAVEPGTTTFHDFLELRKNTGDDRRRTHDEHRELDWDRSEGMEAVEWTCSAQRDSDLHELAANLQGALRIRGDGRARRDFRQKIPAIELWKSMLRMIFEPVTPGHLQDPCNVRSPQDHAGVIHSSICVRRLL